MKQKLKAIATWIPVGLAIVYASITPYIFTNQALAMVSGMGALIAAFCFAISRGLD